MKKLLCYLGLAFVFITGCSKELQVTVASDVIVEYGEELDNSVLFTAENSDENISVKKVAGFDTTQVGEQTLKVTFTDGEKEVEKEVTITVEDTQNPEITIEKEEVTVTVGDEITLKDNVKEVSDPVDGALEYSDEEVETNGYYIDKGELDTNKAGTYEVTVIAKDKNGNEAKKTFNVVVKAKSPAKADASSSSDSSTTSSDSSNKSSNSSSSETKSSSTTSNSNTNGSSGTTASQGSSSSTQQSSSSSSSSSNTTSNNSQGSSQTNQCSLSSSQYSNQLGNTGKLFNTKEEAHSWASAYIKDDDANGAGNIATYAVIPVSDNCDEEIGYTVSFNYVGDTILP